MDTLLNREIKGYAIREQVGSGGFGAVYRAVQPSVGREVAIKVILPQFANEPEFVRRFEVEAQLIARLEHPHIVPLYDFWRDPDGAYLVTRLLRGSLRASLERHPWTLDTVARLLEQIAGALTIAHREGIVHRDIKPDNILLDEDENAYLSDFGIAKNLHVRSGTSQSNLEIAGSPAYLSPEQIRSDEITERSDLYSLGYVLYELLTGEKPFRDAKTPGDYIMKHLSEPMPMLSIQHTHIPAAIDEVLQTVTAKDPSHRYANALRFAAAFRAALPIHLPRTVSQPLVDPLTERELEVLRLMIEGLDNNEIAQRLFLTPGTVKWYIKQVYSKLDAHSRQQAVERALNLKLNEPRSTQSQSPLVLLDQPTIQGIKPALRLVDPENPYKGLRAFQEHDAADFFGRAALTERLLSRMVDGGDSARLLTVVGPSGSGKSSVVRAGLIPALRKGALNVSPHPFIVDFLPGTHPLEELEAALLRVAVNPMPDLLEQLQTDRRGLVRAAKRLLPNDFETELILVVDQFEELFTLVTNEALRAHFIDNLLSAAADPRGRVRVILTLRADFYDRPLLYPRLAEMVRANTEVVIPLSAREMEQAIVAPLESIGMSAENGLVATILHDIGEQPGTLPLLQYTLTELFARREGLTLTLDGYKATGGILGALARRAEDIYNSLDAQTQTLTRQLFLRMVTLGEGTEDTRRRVLLTEFRELANEGDLEVVLDTFARYRLLTLDRDPLTRGPTVEIAHEALIREWSRMREWLSENRDDIRLQRQLNQLALEWQNAVQDVSFLLRGSHLEIFEKWASETQLALTQPERKYLQASLSYRAQEQAAENSRRSHEILLEKRSRNFLRGLVAVLLLAALGAFGLSGVAVNQRNNAQRSSDQFHSLSLAADSQLVSTTYDNELALNLGLAAIDMDNPPARAQLALSEAAYAPGTRWYFDNYSGTALSLALSPDGRYAAVGSGRAYIGALQSEDNAVHLLDLRSGEQIRAFEGHVDTVSSIAFSADGRYLLTGSFDILSDSAQTSIILWDVATSEIIQQYTETAGPINAVDFSADERYFLSVAVAADDPNYVAENGVTLWEVNSGQPLRHFGTDLPGTIRYAALSSDGRYAVLIYFDPENELAGETIVLYDVTSGERHQHTFAGGYWGVLAIRGDTLVHVSDMVRVWDIGSGTLLHEVATSSFLANLTAATISLDERTIAFAEVGGRIQVRDIATLDERITFINPDSNIMYAIEFTSDGTHLLSSAEGGVRFWDLMQGALVQQYGVTQSELPLQRIVNVQFMPDGETFLGLSSDNNTLLVYDRDSGDVLQSIVYPGNEGPGFTGSGLDVTSDGGMAVLGTRNRALLYDLESGTLIREFVHDPENRGLLSHVDISPDGNTVLTGAQNLEEGMILWDLNTGEALHRFVTSPNVLQDLNTQCGLAAFNPEGDVAVSGCNRGELIFYELETYTEIQRLVPENPGFAFYVVFSPDGRMVLTANSENTLTLWDIESGTVIHRLNGHSGPVRGAAFSPDGRLAASGAADGLIILWDVATGQAVRQMRWMETGRVFRVAFSPDGQYVLAGGDHGLMSLWRVDETLTELTDWVYANRYIPNLTCDQRALYLIMPLCD